jgi:hypothetical protein
MQPWALPSVAAYLFYKNDPRIEGRFQFYIQPLRLALLTRLLLPSFLSFRPF